MASPFGPPISIRPETPIPVQVQVDGILQVKKATYRIHDLVALTPGDDELTFEVHLRGEEWCYEHVFETEAERDAELFAANKHWYNAFKSAWGR